MIEMDEYQCRLYEPMEMFSFQKFSQGILRPTLNLTRLAPTVMGMQWRFAELSSSCNMCSPCSCIIFLSFENSICQIFLLSPKKRFQRLKLFRNLNGILMMD